jgi:hypothetical protein
MDQQSFMTIIEAFRIPGRNLPGGFAALGFLSTLGFNTSFFGGGAGGSVVPPGDYLATLTVGGRTMKQRIRVERGPIITFVAPMP